MKAIFNKDAKRKYTTSHRREKPSYFENYKAIIPSPEHKYLDYKECVDLRLYSANGNTWSCVIWVRTHGETGHEIQVQGSGSAGGYGYHKPSAAAAIAIENAGFTLDLESSSHRSISGMGDEAIKDAAKAIATAIGYPNALIIKSHF